MKKNILIILSLVALICVIPLSNVLAFGPNPTKAEERMEAHATGTASQLATITQRGDTMIADRLNSLQRLLARISNDKRLSDADKASLTSDINTTISGLNTLKAKIDADTTPDTARTDVKSIITNFHIYVLYEPKIRLLITIDNLQTSSANITALVTKVQTLITKLQGQGKDTTAAQNALNDVTTQLSAINTLLATDKTLVSNVNFQTTDPQSIFVQVRKDMSSVRQDFAKIRADFATIRGNLKLLINVKTGSASSSAK